MSIEDIENLGLRDLNYSLQIDKILNSSLGTSNVKPRKIKSPFSEEMVKEYRDELSKPIIITDAAGVEHSYKYHPATTIPVIDAYIPPQIIHDEVGVRNHIAMLLNTIVDFEKEKDLIRTEIARLTALINSGTLGKRQRNAEIGNINKYKRDIEGLDKNIRDVEADVIATNQLLEDNKINLAINQAEKSRIDNINRTRIDNFINEMNLLNSGEFKMDQYPNETDEEYLNRLKDVAETPGNDYYTEVEAEIDNIKKFKANMKDLIRSDVEIEKVSNNLDTDTIFAINKIFSLVKSQFLKLFGFNNKSITTEEIVDFLTNMTNKSANLITGNEPAIIPGAPVPLMPGAPITADIVIENANNALIFDNIRLKRKLFLKIGRKPPVGRSKKEEKFIMFSHDGNVGTFINIFFGPAKPTSKEYDRSIKYLLSEIGLNKEDYVKYFGATPTQTNVEKFLEDNGIVVEPTTDYNYVPPGAGGHGQHIYGMGVEKLPQFCTLGKVLVRLDRLYYKNILSVLTKTKSNITGFKPCPVSDEFVNIVMKLCKKIQPTMADIKALKLNEKELYDTLLYISGVHKSVDVHTRDSSIDKLKEKLEIVEGEISSGNNNEKLLYELLEILDKLSHLGVITRADAKRHFEEIKSEYF